MPRARTRPDAAIAALLLVLAVAALVQILAFWPGIMVWDSIRQYGQALSGRYDDWHPPAMNWLWRQLGLFGRGPAPMLVLQILLYWAGFALIASRAPRWRAAAIVALALLPVSLVLMGTILKDSLMAGTLLLATGLIARRREDDRRLALAAGALLLAAATLRFNAVPACLPLALLLLPRRWIGSHGRLAVAALILAVPLALALPAANRLLEAERSHVELSLVIYDLGGITRFSGQDAFPPTGVADPVVANRRCYSPVSWDSYAWWVAEPCPIGFTTLEPGFARRRDATRVWLSAIALHPLAYAAHRLAHFNADVRFLTDGLGLPPLTLATDPNPWDFAVPPSALRDRIGRLATASLATPLGWPVCWLALAAAVLIAGADRLATALATSSLLYGLSYLPLGVASEVRYHLWTMIAAGLAACLSIGRGRQHWAWLLPVAVAFAAAIGHGIRIP